MAQSTILAAAQTAATSSTVTVASGNVISLGIFADSLIPPNVVLYVKQDTPGTSNNVIAKLSHNFRAITISSPGVYTVTRPNISSGGVNVGVYLEN